MTIGQALELIYHVAERVDLLSSEETEALNMMHDFIVNHFGED